VDLLPGGKSLQERGHSTAEKTICGGVTREDFA